MCFRRLILRLADAYVLTVPPYHRSDTLLGSHIRIGDEEVHPKAHRTTPQDLTGEPLAPFGEGGRRECAGQHLGWILERFGPLILTLLRTLILPLSLSWC